MGFFISSSNDMTVDRTVTRPVRARCSLMLLRLEYDMI